MSSSTTSASNPNWVSPYPIDYFEEVYDKHNDNSHGRVDDHNNEGVGLGIGTASNRFTLTDYVYDREDEKSDIHIRPLTTNTTRVGEAPKSRLTPGAAPSVVPGSSQPRGLVPNNHLGPQIARSFQPSLAERLGAKGEGEIATYPPAASTDSTSNTMGFFSTASKAPSAQRDLPSPSQYSPSISIALGPQISPSTNAAIKRLPPIPTSPPRTPALSSPSGTSPPPPLSASLSFTSLASTIPSPLLPPLQLNPGLYPTRPSLATLPSIASGNGSTVGLKMREAVEKGEMGTELTVLPSLPSLSWENDPSRSVSFVGLDQVARGEKNINEESEKGGIGVTFRNTRPEREKKKNRWLDWIFPDSLYCRLLLGTVVTELVIDLIIEANILWRFNTEVKSTNSTSIMLENKRRLPIFLIIFGLAHLWQLLLTIIAIRTKNTIQISAITIFNYCFLIWAVIQVSELRGILGDLQTSLQDDTDLTSTSSSSSTNLLNLPLNVLTAVIIGVVATCCLILTVLAYFVRREFGWQRYRFLGADLQIRGYYRRFQIFECLVFFASFFSAGFGIQFIWLVLQKTDAEYIITWIVFPLSLILLVIGRTAAKYENKPFMIFFCTSLILGQAYFIFKLARIWQQSTTTYQNVNKSLTVFDALSILCLMACFIWGVLVYRDFGKGLKGAVLSQHPRSPRVGFNRWRSGEEGQEKISAAAQKRLSID